MFKSLIPIITLIVLVMVYFKPDRALNEVISQGYGSSIVQVTQPSNVRTGGTGFVTRSKSGAHFIITNSHVCQLQENQEMAIGNSVIDVYADGRRMPVQIQEIASTTDLCALRIENDLFRPLELDTRYEFYEEIAAVGYPLLGPLNESHGLFFDFQKVVLGWDANEEECKRLGFKWQVVRGWLGLEQGECMREIYAGASNVIVFPGSSGSPVFNRDGKVVGVIFAGDSRTNWGFFVPSIDVKKLLEIY